MAVSFWLCYMLAVSSAFLVDTVQLSSLERPHFVGETPLDGSCISVPFGTTWTAKIEAQSNSRQVNL